MEFQETKNLSNHQKVEIRLLWNREYPIIIQHKNSIDFENYLSGLKDTNHVLVLNENKIIGWYIDFIRENNRWFAMIIDTTTQGKGIGKMLIEKAKRKHKELNGWIVIDNKYLKKNNEIYKSPIDFYKKLGFTIFENKKLASSILNAIKIQLKS